MNQILLRGRVAATPTFSHDTHETSFYLLWADVPRLSGNLDRLRVLCAADLLSDVAIGTQIEVEGEVRSFNNKSGVGSRLVLSVFARRVALGAPSESQNAVLLGGTLCRDPLYRTTPLGREITDLMLAVPRHYSRVDYLPLIAWGGTARLLAGKTIGDEVWVEGRFQSRKYNKVTEDGAEERTAYEISVTRTAPDKKTLLELTDMP